ncbi:Nuclear pore membrane glycoprotein 210, partial [Stegodyphus mimosarum]
MSVLNTHFKAKYYQVLHPYGSEGNLRIIASIIGYKPSFVKDMDMPNGKVFPPINSSLNFILVEEAEVSPKKISVYNSPSNKVYLNVTKGSGYFHVEASDSKKAE